MKLSAGLQRITVAIVVLAAVLGGSALAQQVAKKFVFGQSGGASMEASDDIFWKPFTARTGIAIEPLVPSSFGKLRAMIESGNVTASLWDLGSTDVEQAIALNLIEKIDWDQVKPGPMFPETKRDYAFGQTYFSTGMAWRKGTTPIETWADFWNVEKFPGKRCLSDFATFTLPLAVLAAGVPKDKLYPLDLDLAFKMLDKIKPNVSVWWNTGSQPAQLLSDGEVAYCSAWNGRIMPVQGLEFNYNQGMLEIAYYVVPRGAPPAEKAAAMLLLHDWTDPKLQAEYAKRVFYPGSSPDLVKYLPDDIKDRLPTSPKNKDVQFLNNAKWWFDNADLVQKRWQEWKLTR